ncbi:plasmid partitioning protein RepB C-terminal domain-containing protein [Limnohabitans sp.]|uniref:plasmid partitioning protein RepB C-terminal domain-containing protein n=1 Tax=Limnohabitans sp. TaxID=1907725 RepID=UPI00286F14F1|nr:plasmid partitioning protein RepB C-terminal domain-containing protein [Limnohabitans sp.]
MTQMSLGFIPTPMTIPFEKLLPSRKAPDGLMSSRKFKQIISSIDSIGLIEPLTVTKVDKSSGMHLLLDGHIRMFALQELGFKDAPCLVATDDESYTYNNRINRLSTIQEHFMIRRAVDRGVTPARLAKSLELDIELITKKINLLDGICAEAVRLLRDKHFSANISPVLRKLKPTRQVECVELMVATNNITVPYAQALLAATHSSLLVNEGAQKKIKGVTPEQMLKMEREMANLEGQFKLIEQSYGQDVLNLVLAKGYLAKLLGNEAVIRFLSQNTPDILREFSSIVQTTSLDNQ